MNNRKFSIIKTIDIYRIFNEIDNEIDNYINQNGYDYMPYLFMNKDTADAIWHEVKKCLPVVYDANKCSKDGAYGKFANCKIFIDNDLKFGTVEIR